MDSIKTHCYATFDGQEAADRAIAALQGLQWPERSFKRLEAKMGDVTAKEVRFLFIFLLLSVLYSVPVLLIYRLFEVE